MPVNSKNAEYQKKERQWKIVRDCVEGQIAIKENGTLYLPRPAGHTQEDYDNYKNRAIFFDGTSRTAEGLHGHIFAKDPVQVGADKISDAFKALLKNVDASGTSLDEFVSNSTWDIMQPAWGGILVDHPPVEPGTSLAENKSTAFLKLYNAESIYNWRYSVIKGAKKLSFVVLREDIEEAKPDDIFETVITEAYRVLRFDDNNHYVQEIYKKDEKAKDRFISDGAIPIIVNGQHLDYIPFFTLPGEVPEKSMLLGLAQENIGHYQKTADYENGLHYTSIPTPIAENMEQPFVITKGEKGKDIKTPQKVTLGGTQFKFFCQKNADGTIADVRVKYLEFTGAGLGQLLSALNACLDRMAKLGLLAIGSEKKGVETAEVAKIHRASEHGVLGAFARAVNDKITSAIRLFAVWNGIPENEAELWSYELPTDFNYEELSAQIIAVMHSARQSGEIPRRIWFIALKKAGYIPESMTFDEFLQEIDVDEISHGPDGDEGEKE
jgi:hypothetical protein